MKFCCKIPFRHGDFVCVVNKTGFVEIFDKTKKKNW